MAREMYRVKIGDSYEYIHASSFSEAFDKAITLAAQRGEIAVEIPKPAPLPPKKYRCSQVAFFITASAIIFLMAVAAYAAFTKLFDIMTGA